MTKTESFAIFCSEKNLFLSGTKRDNLSDTSACIWNSGQEAQEVLDSLVPSRLRVLGLRTYGQQKYNLEVVKVLYDKVSENGLTALNPSVVTRNIGEEIIEGLHNAIEYVKGDKTKGKEMTLLVPKTKDASS